MTAHATTCPRHGWADDPALDRHCTCGVTWVTTTDRHGRRHYTRAMGHIIDGHGFGRMRWTVVYPDGNYGMTDSLAEAKAWADVDARQEATR